jgi:septal ring factor EnvC (AmiA/AmiB activator)
MKKCLILAALLFSTATLAQQPSPSQVALQITGILGQWAQMIEAQQAQIETLNKKSAELQAKLDAVTAERDQLKGGK